MIEIPNPWMTDAAAITSQAADTAVVAEQPQAATAGLPSDDAFLTTMEVPEEAPAVIENPEDRRDFDIDGTEHIHEIFFGYAKQPESEFPPGFDPHKLMDELEAFVDELSEPPSFLRQA